MKQLMERWRRLVLEADQGDELVIDLEDEEEEVDELELEPGDAVSIEKMEEWELDDDEEYPSRKKARRDKMMLKPDRKSWNAGFDQLSSLAGGIAEKKKPRKKQCHAYNPSHGQDGRFTDPEKEKGSSSMKPPDAGSPEDCTWGQARRMQANRSTQSTQRPCGRAGKYRCKDGSKKWSEGVDEVLVQTDEGQGQQLEAYLRGVVAKAIDDGIKKHMQSTGCSFQDLIRAMTAWTAAEKGGGKS